MKILFINPPRSAVNLIREHAPDSVRRHVHEKLVGPPLGVLALAGNLRDHDVDVVDLKAASDLDPGLDWRIEGKKALETLRPQFVGVTFLASEVPMGLEILSMAKDLDRGIVTAAGGIHAALRPGDFNHPDVDLVFLSHAKVTLRQALERLESGRSLDDLPNLGIWRDGKREYTQSRDPLDPPDLIAEDVLPDRTRVSKVAHAYRLRPDTPQATYLHTSLGCPYRCTFCAIWPQMRGGTYLRPVDSIMTELGTLSEEVVRFADANTFSDPVWAHELFDRILAEKKRRTYVADVRIDTVARHPDLLEKAAQAGLKVVICGIESDSPEELKAYRKDSDPAFVKRAVDTLHRLGIHVRGNYIVRPDYTEKEFDRLERFAASHPIDFAGFTIATPMPGTVYWRQVRDRIAIHDLRYYNFMNSVFETTLPEMEFYQRVAHLWTVKRGDDVI